MLFNPLLEDYNEVSSSMPVQMLVLSQETILLLFMSVTILIMEIGIRLKS